MAVGELAWLFLEPDRGLDHCPRILLSCFRARTSRPEVVCDVEELLSDDVFHGALAEAKVPEVPDGEPSLLLPLIT